MRCVCKSGCDPWGVGGKVCWHGCLGHGVEMGAKRQGWGTGPRAWRGSYLTPSEGRFWEAPRGGAAFAHAAQCPTPTCSAKVSHDGVARLCTPLQPLLDDVWAEEDVTCLMARQKHLLDPASGGHWRASSSGVCLFWKDFAWGPTTLRRHRHGQKSTWYRQILGITTQEGEIYQPHERPTSTMQLSLPQYLPCFVFTLFFTSRTSPRAGFSYLDHSASRSRRLM